MKAKKTAAIFLAFMQIVHFSTVFSYDTTELTMRIDETNVVRTIGPEMYGVNMEWAVGPSNYSQIKTENGTVVKNETFPQTYGDMLKFTRKAGTSADYFLWKDALGDISSRKTQKLWGVTDKVYEGIVEWLECLYSATDSPRVDYVVNIYSDTFENIADVVEFMLGDGTVNYNGGENWAEYRIKMGFKNPIDVFAWEIGNETDWSVSPVLSIEDYTERARKAIDIIRSIDPDAKICLHAHTAIWNGTDGSQNWHRYFLKELGQEIDYVSVHYYYPAGYVTRADPPINALKRDIFEITGSDRIKLYYSEQAPAPENYQYSKENSYAYCLPHTIWGATAEAEFYLRKWLDPWVVASTCHSIDSANWSISYTDQNNECKLTAVGENMKTFSMYGVGNMYKSSLDTFSVEKSSSVAGGVIEDENGNVNIIFTNRNEAENVRVNFEFKENLYRLKHVRKIHGDVKKADNWYRKESIWEYDNPYRVEVTDEDYNSSEAFSSYEFEPLSIYALQLEQIPIEDKEKIVNQSINNSFSFGYGYPNIINHGQIEQYSDSYMPPKLCNNLTTYVTVEMARQIFDNDVRFELNGNIVECNIGGESIIFDLDNNTVNADNVPVAQIIDGKVYIPIRAVAKKAGYSLAWDGRAFIIAYKNGTVMLPNSSFVREGVYKRLRGY